jgi:hypothetical protein
MSISSTIHIDNCGEGGSTTTTSTSISTTVITDCDKSNIGTFSITSDKTVEITVNTDKKSFIMNTSVDTVINFSLQAGAYLKINNTVVASSSSQEQDSDYVKSYSYTTSSNSTIYLYNVHTFEYNIDESNINYPSDDNTKTKTLTNTTTSSSVNDNLYFKNNNIINFAATDIYSSLKSSLLFKLKDYKYINSNSTINNNNYLDFTKMYSYGFCWGGTRCDLPFYYSGSLLPFIDKKSCPIIKAKTSGDCIIPYDYNNVLANEQIYDLRYNTFTGNCEYKKESDTSWVILNNYEGVFLALQGGGGGGGGGSCLNVGITAVCIGAGGGGGGGFVLIYLNLKQLKTIAKVNIGKGGTVTNTGDHVQIDLGPTGGDGGDTILSTTDSNGNSINLVIAYGGKGGQGSDNGPTTDEGRKGNGGVGGGFYINSAYQNVVFYLLGSCSGGDGGKRADISGYSFGVPYGHKLGENGHNILTSSVVNSGILKETQPLYREGSPWTTDWTSGHGQNNVAVGTWDYTSGGGGGGGSVCSQIRTTNYETRYGYGMGGYGGSAEAATVHGEQAGLEGCLIILTPYNL